MPEIIWLLFIVASLVLIVTPGRDMILVMSRSIPQGSSAGVVAVAGVSLGLIGHTVQATLGLGVILRASKWLLVALKLAGAAYLDHLGAQLLRVKQHELAISTGTDSDSRRRPYEIRCNDFFQLIRAHCLLPGKAPRIVEVDVKAQG